MQRQLVVILLVALVLVLLTVQNPNPVPLQFLSWEAPQVPLIVVILISLLVGVIISSILSLIKQSRLKEKIRRLQREIEELKYPPVVSPDQEEELDE
ncbi:MAG: LapA family protein [Planctomycetota bacterium]|jgi:uncharacterized integral membrane protein